MSTDYNSANKPVSGQPDVRVDSKEAQPATSSPPIKGRVHSYGGQNTPKQKKIDKCAKKKFSNQTTTPPTSGKKRKRGNVANLDSPRTEPSKRQAHPDYSSHALHRRRDSAEIAAVINKLKTVVQEEEVRQLYSSSESTQLDIQKLLTGTPTPPKPQAAVSPGATDASETKKSSPYTMPEGFEKKSASEKFNAVREQQRQKVQQMQGEINEVDAKNLSKICDVTCEVVETAETHLKQLLQLRDAINAIKEAADSLDDTPPGSKEKANADVAILLEGLDDVIIHEQSLLSAYEEAFQNSTTVEELSEEVIAGLSDEKAATAHRSYVSSYQEKMAATTRLKSQLKEKFPADKFQMPDQRAASGIAQKNPSDFLILPIQRQGKIEGFAKDLSRAGVSPKYIDQGKTVAHKIELTQALPTTQKKIDQAQKERGIFSLESLLSPASTVNDDSQNIANLRGAHIKYLMASNSVIMQMKAADKAFIRLQEARKEHKEAVHQDSWARTTEEKAEAAVRLPAAKAALAAAEKEFQETSQAYQAAVQKLPKQQQEAIRSALSELTKVIADEIVKEDTIKTDTSIASF